MRLSKYQCPFGPNFVLGLSPAAWFRADTGVTVTGSGAAQVNDQANSDHALVLPGVAGNYASTPDSAAASITGDIDIRVRVSLADWTPAGHQALVGKWTAAPNLSYQFYIALATFVPTIAVSADGTAVRTVGASAAPTVSDGDTLWLRATRASASGDCNFYTSTDTTNDPSSVTWTLLGTANRTTAAGGIADTTAVVELGIQNGTSSPANGKIYRAAVYSTIGGTSPAWDFNAADFTKGSTSATSSTTGEVWTVNQSGNPPAHIGNKYDLLQVTDASRPPYLSYSGTKYLYLPGVAGNYASTPDSSAASITGDIDIRMRLSADDWTPASIPCFIAKYGAAGTRSFLIQLLTTGELQFTASADGTAVVNYTSTVAPTVTNGAAIWIRATRASSSGDVNFYTAADQATEPTSWTQLGTTVAGAAGALFDSTSVVAVGIRSDAINGPLFGKIYRAIIKNGIDGTTVVDFNPNLDASDGSTSFASSATGETWTVNKGSSGLIAYLVGKPWLMGDGSADILATSGFTLNQPLTRYIVGRSLTWTLNDYIADGNAKDSAAFIQSATTPRFKISAGSAIGENAGLALNTTGVMCCVINGASSLTQVNLGTPVTGDAGAANAGGLTLFGSGTVATGFWNGMVAEDITFPTAHDATQRARVIQYLAGWHGIAL